MSSLTPSTESQTPAPLISLTALTKTFVRGTEEIHAINGLTLTIDRGEFVAITGASGSGKSTLMYIMGLLDKETAGTYHLRGKLTGSLRDSERAGIRNGEFGFIFQSFHLLPRATALRNVAMPLEYSGSYGAGLSTSEVDGRAKEALSRVGLGDRLHHRPNELSGGQRQRVAIARALINNPSVLFADEPTGNLDTRNANDILELFKSLHADKHSIILVTHDPALAGQAHRQIKMLDGKIVEDIRREAA